MSVMDSIPPILFDGSLAVGEGLFMVWLVVTGRLIPRALYRDRVEESKAKDETIRSLTDQLSLSREVGRTVKQTFEELQRGDP